MRLLLIGCGGVGEIIARVLSERSKEESWLESLVIADYDYTRVEKALSHISDNKKLNIIGAKVNASNKDEVISLIEKYECDCLFDASPPYLANVLFDAAQEAKVDFLNMGTWSVPEDGIVESNSAKQMYSQFMTDYNFKHNDAWVENEKSAIICVGIDPGVVNVFSKFAAKHLFDEIKEIHVKDGSNIALKNGGDDIAFGFNVWTVLDECLNPSVTWSKEQGFIGYPAFAGEETFYFPEDIGPLKLYQIEHEEVVLIPKYLEAYGLEKCSYKIALDKELVDALKLIDKLGLRSLEKIDYNGNEVTPRDIVARLLPQPDNIDDRYMGKMCVGVHCIGVKDGLDREVFLYQTYEQIAAWDKYNSQAVVVQTAIGAAISVELLGKGIWVKPGVHSPEAFEPEPYLALMKDYDYAFDMIEMNSQYNKSTNSVLMDNYL